MSNNTKWEDDVLGLLQRICTAVEDTDTKLVVSDAVDEQVEELLQENAKLRNVIQEMIRVPFVIREKQLFVHELTMDSSRALSECAELLIKTAGVGVDNN